MNIYLIIVVILFILAITDLIVGVSNDAVNFLNSSIGSKAAPKWVILLVASAGILMGAIFSSGMMEVARKGIFHPEQFYFSEIMIIFLAVMLTDIILLDTFNTIGLPTSTTVSIVFELLGSAVAVSLIKIHSHNGNLSDLSKYINSGNALVIISGILLSIVIAFSLGAIVQYITRLIFSFNYKKPLKYLGSIIGSFAITAITYFILIKGLKGASFITKDMLIFINNHIYKILLFSFIAWAILLQILVWLFKANIPKIIVLAGTFALAMAFAGNDLVNFIGVPLAGLESYKIFIHNPGADPGQLTMEALKNPVHSDTYLLLIAGIIMIITLILSRKAKHVTETEVNLGKQNSDDERFGSTGFSRLIVRRAINFNNAIIKITPKKIQTKISDRFSLKANQDIENVPAFDLIRASVNLTVASIIISFATSLKLPLSTTYVTFMVAMGTSLSDRAWDRDSAVYRITGVLTVISGWFVTAFIAFFASFIMAYIINWGGIYSVGILVVIGIIYIYKSYSNYKKKSIKKENLEKEDIFDFTLQTKEGIDKSNSKITSILLNTSKLYYLVLEGLFNNDYKSLKRLVKEVEEINNKTKKYKNKLYKTLKHLDEESIKSGHFFVQTLDYLREIAHCLTYISTPIFEHVNNNHKPIIKAQKEELTQLNNLITDFINFSVSIVKKNKYTDLSELIDQQQNIIVLINTIRKNQIKRIKKEEVNTRNSILYFNILEETKNMLLYIINLLKSQRDFITDNIKY